MRDGRSMAGEWRMMSGEWVLSAIQPIRYSLFAIRAILRRAEGRAVGGVAGKVAIDHARLARRIGHAVPAIELLLLRRPLLHGGGSALALLGFELGPPMHLRVDLSFDLRHLGGRLQRQPFAGLVELSPGQFAGRGLRPHPIVLRK